jgi:2-keto-4-pentenoate hydratase/2-oxohepta-3-ene-1,7-dioic acid hydratase in catechol pathway
LELITFYYNGLRVGVLQGDEVWDLRRAYELHLVEVDLSPRAEALAAASVPVDMSEFIALHPDPTEFQGVIDRLSADSSRKAWFQAQGLVRPISDVRLLPPVLRPSKVVMIGNSYRDHIENVARAKGEAAAQATVPPDVKVSFFKTASALVASGDPVRYPADTDQWDFEGEFAIVIGRTCSGASEDEAEACIFGFTALNDASVRDVPQSLGGLTSPKAKSADTLAPLGPSIVTRGTLGKDPNSLGVRVLVNGEVRQDSNTSQLLWPINRIVAATSKFLTLYPGDIIATGASAGVGLESGRYLAEGDVVRIEIEGLGVLENSVGSPK